MNRLGPDDHGLIRGKLPAMGGKPNDVTDGSKLSALAGGLAEGAMNLFDQASLAATAKMTDLKIKGGFLQSIVENMFGVGQASDKDKAKADKAKEQEQLAGVMQKGSQEAYSTIVQAMLRGKKDPNVQATEKQTKQLIDAWFDNPQVNLNMVAAFP
jgi:hypothetical protein